MEAILFKALGYSQGDSVRIGYRLWRLCVSKARGFESGQRFEGAFIFSGQAHNPPMNSTPHNMPHRSSRRPNQCGSVRAQHEGGRRLGRRRALRWRRWHRRRAASSATTAAGAGRRRRRVAEGQGRRQRQRRDSHRVTLFSLILTGRFRNKDTSFVCV